jgi:glutathione S-transferase
MLGIPFEHQSLSVFRNFDEFHAINPLVKAPTLVFDDGEVMVDSSQIIAWLEHMAPRPQPVARRPGPLPALPAAHQPGPGRRREERAPGVRNQGAPQDPPRPGWLRRVEGQIRDTYAVLEQHVGDSDWLCGDRPTQADITVAVAWRFTHATAPGLVADSDYPTSPPCRPRPRPCRPSWPPTIHNLKHP